MRSLLLLAAVAPADLLEQPLRRRIMNLIRRRPGIHASQLCRESGEAWGTVQYHLGLLRKSNMVSTQEAGRERCFFPAGIDADRARLLTLMHQGRRLEILECIAGKPGLRQVDVCDEVSVSRKTFRASIAPLVEEGLVVERRGLQSNQYFPGDRLEEVMDLQNTVDLAEASESPEPLAAYA